jgi:ligand-binding sensor domain-containing protein
MEAAPAAPEAPTGTPIPVTGPIWHAVDVWHQAQGLPQDNVIAIRQTRDGYMWFGTKGGLARFDGVRFLTFKERALGQTEIWDMAEDRDGSLWVATYGEGLAHLKDGKVQTYQTADGIGTDFIGAVCVDARGDVWIGTDKGVARLRGADRHVQSYGEKDGLSSKVVGALLCEPDGSVWLGTKGGGLHRFHDEVIDPSLLPDTGAQSVTEIARTPDGALWVAAHELLFRYKNDVWRKFGEADGLGVTRSQKLHADRGGRLWVATAYGLYSLRDDETFEHHEIVGELSSKPAVRSVGGDDEGSIWIGHAALGLVRLSRGYFATYSLPHGISSPSIRTVFADSKGTVWIGTPAGLDRIRDGQVQNVVQKDGSPIRFVSSMIEDRQGRVWLGTPTGASRFTPSVKPCANTRCVEEIVPVPSVPSASTIRVMYVDRQGDVWVGLDQQGLARVHDDVVTMYTQHDGLSDDSIRGLAEDPQGRLWVGTKEGGVSVFEGGRFRSITDKDGLAANHVQALYGSADGTLWVATRRGLTRVKDGHFFSYTAEKGLFAEHIYGLVEDAEGSLWMGCSRGIFRVRRQSFDDVASGKADALVTEAFGVEHGLRSAEVAAGYAPVATRTSDGRIWFATTDGVSVVAPKDVSRNRQPPAVHVEELRVDGTAFSPTAAAVARPGKGDIFFRYTATSFADATRVRFKVRLEPYDPDWIDTSLRVTQYTNIPPGRYRFRVKAANSDGLWNETGSALDLTLQPHFYQTRWFSALVVLSLGVATFGAHRWRVRTLQERARELRVRIDEALAQVKTLSGLLPVCASCKKIRDDSGYWNQMETYISQHSSADFSHGICPECVVKLYPEYAAIQTPKS